MEESTNNEQPKKKRGRPSKNPDGTKSAYQPIAPEDKIKMGRPRKKPGEPKSTHHWKTPDEKIKGPRGGVVKYKEKANVGNVMSTPENLAINQRFIEVVDTLIENGEADSRFGIMSILTGNTMLIYRILDNPSKVNLPPYYLWALVTKYKVNSDWLLTGEGEMFKK
jgi:hypothetical protein